MGGVSGKEVNKVYPHPEELETYQKTKTKSACDENDLHPKLRKTTDVCVLNIFAFFLVALCVCIFYCIVFGDIGRVVYGYDNCGSVCGQHLHKVKELESCYDGINENHFGSYQLILYKPGQSVLYDRICTNNCSGYLGYKQFLNRCISSGKKSILDKIFTKEFFVEVSEDFTLYWKVLVYMSMMSFVISLSVLLLCRLLARLMVWIVLIGAVIACAGAAVYSWVTWKDLKQFQPQDPEIGSREVNAYFGLAILLTVVTLLVVLMILVMIKRIALVIQLFDEAGEAIADMPHLLLEPLLTFVSLFLVMALWIYFSLWISSAGYLTEKRHNVYYYRRNGFMDATNVLNFFGMLWTTQFVIGCQHMVIAGAVSKWYFTRDKSQLSSPLSESFYNLTRYHLGTIATGSLLIAIVQFVRTIISWQQKLLQRSQNSLARRCLDCCLWVLESFLNMLNVNAYIITAMYGYSFFKAAKLAFTHLASNPLRVVAINSVGDFVLFLSKLLVVASSVGLASYVLKTKEGVQHLWVPLVLIGLFSFFISHCFMTVYEMTIDTIFICFCEDCELNDGVSKPYYMSRGLMEFVENSKRTIKVWKDGATVKNSQIDLDEAKSSQSVSN